MKCCFCLPPMSQMPASFAAALRVLIVSEVDAAPSYFSPGVNPIGSAYFLNWSVAYGLLKIS